jgi:hypothetical protein
MTSDHSPVFSTFDVAIANQFVSAVPKGDDAEMHGGRTCFVELFLFRTYVNRIFCSFPNRGNILECISISTCIRCGAVATPVIDARFPITELCAGHQCRIHLISVTARVASLNRQANYFLEFFGTYFEGMKNFVMNVPCMCSVENLHVIFVTDDELF